LFRIHHEDAIHRDLHSGNILHSPRTYGWYISDLGFYGPADKPLNSIYGNLPYIAPEVLSGKEYTKASDIFSIPLKYKTLMEECWDADPLKRPDILNLYKVITEIRKTYLQDPPNESSSIFKKVTKFFQREKKDSFFEKRSNSGSVISNNELYTTNLFTSKIYRTNLIDQNVIEGDQEGNHSKPHNFNIPADINDIVDAQATSLKSE
ncbi:2411_t:CDS:2, partial [Funneliformis geosporum]